MRILYLNLEKSWRGGENQILTLAKGLSGKGWEVSIAYPKQNEVALARFRKEAMVVPLPSRSHLDPRNLLLLRRYCRDNDIRIIDANSSRSHSLALLVRKFLPRTRLVVHRRVASDIGNNFVNRRKYLSPAVDSYIAISKYIAGVLRSFGIPESRITVIPSAVPAPAGLLSRTAARKIFADRHDLPADVLWIGSAAALTREKGLEDLLQLSHRLKHERIPYRCLIAGDGILRPEIEAGLKSLDLQNEVRLLGFIDNVPEFLRALDIVIACSRREGLGTSLLDAAFAEAAILATRVGGIPEIVIDEETGLLYEPGDISRAADKLFALATDAGLRERLGANARSHVEREYRVDRMIDRTADHYTRLLARAT